MKHKSSPAPSVRQQPDIAAHQNGYGSAAIDNILLPHPAKADRLPPQNLEAERSCLGSILLDATVFEAVAEQVVPADFYRDSHRVVFEMMVDMKIRGIPIDPVTLADELHFRDQFAKVGGDEFLTEIVNSVPHAINAGYYASIVREKAVGRRAIDVCTELLNRAYSGHFTAMQVIDDAARSLACIEVFRPTQSDEDLGIRRATSYRKKRITFLLPGRIPEDDYTLLAGRGKQGKSQFTMAVGAKVSTGGEWWDGSGTARRGHVLYVSAEDDPERIIIPRLEALGADLSRITIIEAKYKTAATRDRPSLVSFASLQDLSYWRMVFGRIEDPALIVVDPLPSYVGRGVNDRKNSDIRSILVPFIDLVKEFRMTLLGVTHFGKSIDARTAADKILDSIAYVNLARAVLYVAKDPDEPGRVLVMPGPCNFVKEERPSLSFRVVEKTIPDDEGGEITIGIPQFDADTVEADPDDIVNRQGKAKTGSRGPDPSHTLKIAEWLVTFLNGKGPVLLGEIADAAGQAELLGTQKWNPTRERREWSNFTAIYRGADAVPGLPKPHDGWEIITAKDDPSLRSISGKARWALRRISSPF